MNEVTRLYLYALCVAALEARAGVAWLYKSSLVIMAQACNKCKDGLAYAETHT